MNKDYVIFGDTKYELNRTLTDSVYDYIIDIFEHQDGYDRFEIMLQRTANECRQYYVENETMPSDADEITSDVLKSIVYSDIYACLNILLTRYSKCIKLNGEHARFSVTVYNYYNDDGSLQTLFVHGLFHICGIIYSKNMGDTFIIVICDNAHTHIFNVYGTNQSIVDYLFNKHIIGDII